MNDEQWMMNAEQWTRNKDQWTMNDEQWTRIKDHWTMNDEQACGPGISIPSGCN